MTDCFSFMDMNSMGWMMWAGGLFWLLVLAVLILTVAGLTKYLRSGRIKAPTEPNAAGQPTGGS